MSVYAWIIATTGCALTLYVTIEHLISVVALVKRPPLAPLHRNYPSITVIRPIRGLDVGCRENTLALLHQRYPGTHETLFVFDSVADEALPVVSQLVRGRTDARVLIAGSPRPGRTGKLNAMIYAMAQARGELIAFNDSDSRPSPTLLRDLVDSLLANPLAGSTFAPVVSHRAPQTAGEAGYALLMNAWYGPTVTRAAGKSGLLPFIMGELMVLRRSAIAAIGGLEACEGQRADDMWLGHCITKAGLKNVMIRSQLSIVTDGFGFAEFIGIFRRWVVSSQSGLPLRFVLVNWMRGFVGTVAVLATAAGFALHEPLAAVAPLIACALYASSQLRLHRLFSGQTVPLRFAWMPLALPFIGGLVSLSTHFNKRVELRGHSETLDSGARLNRAA